MNFHFLLPAIKDYFCGKRGPNSTYILKNPNQLFKALDSQKIDIQIHPSNEKEKKNLIEMIQFLNQRGREVTVTEFERIFEDDLLLDLASQKIDFKICLRYMLQSYYSAYNCEMDYSLKDYQEIIKKVKYFKEKVEKNCVTEEEKVLFTLYQLADYIKIASIEGKGEFELTPVSDFYASLGRGETICIGYSMALWKVLTELGISCNLVLGSHTQEEDQWGHAWNQVSINGIWYNVELTWYSLDKRLDHLLKSDFDFPNHFPNEENKVYSCMVNYPRKKLADFFLRMQEFPNLFKEYEENKKIR